MFGIISRLFDVLLIIAGSWLAHGMRYNGEMIDRRTEALLYMFPQRVTDNPVRWWIDEQGTAPISASEF